MELYPYFISCKVQNEIHGSDHCPVSAELLSTHPMTGNHLTPGRQMNVAPPKLCFQWWNENQQSIKGFLENYKKSTKSENVSALSSKSIVNVSQITDSKKSVTSGKRSFIHSARFNVQQKKNNGQVSVLSFFKKKEGGNDSSDHQNDMKNTTISKSITTEHIEVPESEPLASFPSDNTSDNTSSTNKSESINLSDPALYGSFNSLPTTQFWSSLLAPPAPPNCYHNEPARLLKVNKPGPNHGRAFWLCARGMGVQEISSNTDKLSYSTFPSSSFSSSSTSSSSPSRTSVGEFRCDFFMWKNSAKRGFSGSNKTDTKITKKKIQF